LMSLAYPHLHISFLGGFSFSNGGVWYLWFLHQKTFERKSFINASNSLAFSFFSFIFLFLPRGGHKSQGPRCLKGRIRDTQGDLLNEEDSYQMSEKNLFFLFSGGGSTISVGEMRYFKRNHKFFWRLWNLSYFREECERIWNEIVWWHALFITMCMWVYVSVFG
jgi:hypothetical protein